MRVATVLVLETPNHNLHEHVAMFRRIRIHTPSIASHSSLLSYASRASLRPHEKAQPGLSFRTQLLYSSSFRVQSSRGGWTSAVQPPSKLINNFSFSSALSINNLQLTFHIPPTSC